MVSPDTAGRIGMVPRVVATLAPSAAVHRRGRWEHGHIVAHHTGGEALRC